MKNSIITFKFWFICFFVVFLILHSCCSRKIVGSSEYTSGIISKVGDEENFLRFAYNIDSIKNINIKIYLNSGFKVFDGIVTRDSVITKYIINDSYKSFINSGFLRYKSKICLNQAIIDLLQGFQNANSLCYNVVKDSINSSSQYLLYTVDYSKILSVDYLKFIKTRKNVNLPSSFIVYFENGNTFKVEIKY